MRTSFNNRYNRNMYELFASDCYATDNLRVIITTLLGSCVAVCLKDPVAGVAGMNHFMLPRKVHQGDIGFTNDTRYGVNAMEVMINEMMKKGALRKRLQAKLFGGGRVMETALNNVADSNIYFALGYMKKEGIPVLASDLGRNEGRKILFFPDTFDVYVRHIHYDNLRSAVKAEKELMEKISSQRETDSDLELFD